ncbi:MAG: triose-phosphate isomerase [Rickettsiaceae bacterium]|nr:triose-phosphate isomerase [Rickettsiaceae bacterium]
MKTLIIVNWKMNLTLDEALSRCEIIASRNYQLPIVIAPPTPYIAYLARAYKNLDFCTQDISIFHENGLYTGEYSAEMIKNCGIKYSIVGHSERRNYFRETNKTVKEKATNCVKAGVIPIICIGEDMETRQNNNYLEFLLEQINHSTPEHEGEIILAYEPLWAIGSGITPSNEEIAEIFVFIKNNKNITTVAKNSLLVYGGSVTLENYKEILSVKNSNGVLVGSAALDIDFFKLLN